MAGFLVSIGKAGEVAERSPAVISANQKEEMLLQKKMVILNRSERSVVHQIKVDQKVLYKRFQSRLVRSKLAFARIMGNKDIEKDLRSKNLGGLNTDIVGHSDEEYSFLEKLEHRPCTANSFSPRVALGARRRSLRKGSMDGERQDLTTPIRDERASSAKARLVASDERKKKGDESQKIQGSSFRPATTIGSRLHTGMLLQNRMRQKTMPPIAENTESLGHLKDIENTGEKNKHAGSKTNVEDDMEEEGGESKAISRGGTDSENSTLSDKEYHNGEKLSDDVEDFDAKKQNVICSDQFGILNPRPKSLALIHTLDESPPISPKQLSRRASRAADFFQEEKKIDLVELRLKEAKSMDYTEKVQLFCEELDAEISAPNKPTVDYYASRLEVSMAQRLSQPVISVPGTPEDENRRAMGNIFVRSLTVPKLNLDFKTG